MERSVGNREHNCSTVVPKQDYFSSEQFASPGQAPAKQSKSTVIPFFEKGEPKTF
jgi:hypothetical protein